MPKVDELKGEALKKYLANKFTKNLDDLDDVDTTTPPTDGQLLGYEATSSQWKPKTVIVPSAINDLSDVDTSLAQNGQALLYEAGTNQWKPGTVTFAANLPIVSIASFPAGPKNRAWQGVGTDGTYIYVATDNSETAQENIISVFDMEGRLLSEKRNAYTGTDSGGRFMSFGDCTVINNKLYCTAYNYNSGGPSPFESKVVVFDLYPTLTQTAEYSIGSGVAECVDGYLGDFWVSYHDQMAIKRFNSSFTLQNTYTLSQPIGADGGYQGIIWRDGFLYCNMHGPNNYGQTFTGKIDKYEWTGNGFTFVKSITPPTYGSTQGIAYSNGRYFFNDRSANAVVITNSIETGKLRPLIQTESAYKIITPTLENGWVAFDTNRTARFWKDQFGIVSLEGMVKSGAINAAAFTLPPGYRPRYDLNFAGISNDAFYRLNIVGNVTANAGWEGYVTPKSGSNIWVSFDGISFQADPTDTTFAL